MLFNIISKIFIVIGILSALSITIDILKNPQKEMPIMNWVWPINGLWAGVFGVWAYFTIGKHRKMDMSNMDMGDMNMNMDMSNMDMSSMNMKDSKEKYSSFWQGVVADTLHCGAGCSLADLIGPWIFLVFPFTLFNNLTFGEWTLDYFLALLTGVTFQYAAISPMMKEKGPKIWLRALKIDFLSLTSWQIGMYGWMALVIFVWFGRLSPFTPEFWFMMQIAMCCGFVTAYPVNWWLVKAGIKMGM
ncbi:DUF4396 domain-containing protein [Candidatus Cetobacterium colombiensis]|uniref:DUF4396 domain-containing protein n=1 Tax=Candidatus Cetobacterium colombiensis TaxID=3073100 RepID=A0ABU4WC47_9FUSO|nr:DUF4396 domain-containing protein [Candidatus Cetobacterium colombiensis]MDX8336068.1 DUF4396 domain-containing protein [Candidatus Cetobacterium colombiensis]